MSKRLILILALAFVVGIACAAYAEVQNVKVSGDINVKGVGRNNFDLTKVPVSGTGQHDNINYEDKESDMLSITRVRVDADLTDNVSTTVRLLNERNWNGESKTGGYSNTNIGNYYTDTGTASRIVAQNDNDEGDISLDLAYVTLKEFLYSPLSLTVGRQELRFGNSLVIGDPDTNLWSSRTALAEGDLSARKSFDALRATLDYNPLVVDLVYAKLEEGKVNLNDDVALGGVNANYALNKNTTLEGFFFSKTKGTSAATVHNLDAGNATSYDNAAGDIFKDKADIVNTVGARVADKTLKNLALDLQAAYQFGTYNPKFDPNARWISATDKRETSNRSAWAAQVMATYDLKDIAMISKWSPSVTGTYTYLSGADRNKTGNKAYKGWDPMFEDQTVGRIMNAIFANTNMHRTSLSAKAKLTDDITANLDYVTAWFAKEYKEYGYNDRKGQAVLSGIATNGATARIFRMGDKKYIGQEIDAALTYDYTEDVQFSLLGGILLPGKNVNGNIETDENIRAAAGELIGSMKVTF